MIGFAIEFGLIKIVQTNIDLFIWINFITLLITAIRFFHGNSTAAVKNRTMSLGRFMFDVSCIMFQFIFLCLASNNIDQMYPFLYFMFLLSIMDVFWLFILILITYIEKNEEPTTKKDKLKAYGIWLLLNLISIVVDMCLYNILGVDVVTLSVIILIFYIVITFIDYFVSNQFFYSHKRKD